jgi:enterochelin esterase-like enzyme
MIVELNAISPALRGNPLGDPHERILHLIVPEGYDGKASIPCVWYLAGYAGVGRQQLAGDLWQEGLHERIIRLTREGQIGPMLIALPDAFTSLGGCQYLSSPAVGDYQTYLREDLRLALEARFPVSRHGIMGKSSGGYGALIHAMERPDLYRAVACHSGDMGFELSLFRDIPLLMDALWGYEDVEAWFEAFRAAEDKKSGRWFGPMSILCLAAVYSPDPSQPLGIALPFDLQNGVLRPEVLARWLEADPVQKVHQPHIRKALESLALLFFDCGDQDEHFLHFGALAFHRALERYGIKHCYERFRGGHRATTHRLDRSLPLLYRALSS